LGAIRSRQASGVARTQAEVGQQASLKAGQRTNAKNFAFMVAANEPMQMALAAA
jgi:hypothetical protein